MEHYCDVCDWRIEEQVHECAVCFGEFCEHSSSNRCKDATFDCPLCPEPSDSELLTYLMNKTRVERDALVQEYKVACQRSEETKP